MYALIVNIVTLAPEEEYEGSTLGLFVYGSQSLSACITQKPLLHLKWFFLHKKEYICGSPLL